MVIAFRDITEARKLELLKEQFLQTVSHELHTTLTSIIGYQDILLSEIPGSLSDKQKELMQITLTNSEVLLDLVNDILELSKLNSGTMEAKLAPVKILPLLDSVVKSFTGQCQKKDLDEPALSLMNLLVAELTGYLP